MLVARYVMRRDECLDVFDIEGAFGTNAVLCEEIVQRCPEELAIDQEF